MPKKKTGHYNICPICEKEFWVEKHREAVGRGKYCSGEVVHHIDENKTNNNIENLALMTRQEHDKLHAPTKRFWEKSSVCQKGRV